MSGPNVLPFGPRDSAVDRQEIVDTLKRMLDGLSDLKGFPANFKLALRERVWERERIFPGGTRQSPVTLQAFVYEHYPVGLGASYEVIENLIRGDNEALGLWTEVTKRKPGESQARDPQTGHMLPVVDNIHDRPSGTSAEAGLRKLQKLAAEGNEQAASELAEVIEKGKPVHRACIDAGVRKETRIDRDVRDRAAQALAERIVSNFPSDELDAAKSDAFACGAKALGVALVNLVGASIMDRHFSDPR